MATSRTTSRSASKARDEVIELLKDDHRRVRKAYREFRKLDESGDDPEACATLVTQVLDDLTVHAELEEELLYPAVRGAIAEEGQIDEAEVEHEMLKVLIGQLRGMDTEDEKFAARFTVLCEYTLHHVKEEEGEMFPALARVKIDWERIAQEMVERRAELTGEMTEGMEDTEDGPKESGATTPGGDDGAGERPSRAERSDRGSAPMPRR
jgi:hemerythrin superfamily protein